MPGPRHPSGPLRRRLPQPVIALVLPLVVAAVTSCSAAPEAGTPDAGASSAPSAPSAPAADPVAPEASEAEFSATVLQVTEDDFSIALPETELEAGRFTVKVSNDGSAVHDLVIEDSSGADVAATAIISPGDSASLEVDLEPGRYVFYCSVANHRGMGMELAVTVT